MIKELAAATLGLAAIFAASPARADYVVYTNRSTFEAALQSKATQTFDNLGSSTQSFGATGLSEPIPGTSQSLMITGSSNYLFSTSSAQAAFFYSQNQTFLLGPTSSSASDGIAVALPSNLYNGAGADVATFATNSVVSFVARTALGAMLTGSVNVDGTSKNSILGFLGVITTTPNDYITSLTFLAPVGANQNVVIDNVTVGITPATVPEPASMALMVAGSVALGFGAIRRRKLRPTTA